MTGRLAALIVVVSAVLAGGGMYYLQVYHFYEDVSARLDGIRLTPLAGGPPRAIPVENLSAIDANSSPIRFRACFETPIGLPALRETYAPHPAPEPLRAPGWFSCFDAEALGPALEAGQAVAFMGTRDIVWGIDRVVAFDADGRGYAWHQINACGAVVFDGEPAPEGCPPPPETD